ncbi:MAG: class II aldolase/adducin family protein [Oscillospiraceae bacterium]|nr:class II aldolase/adducin family protein [Oscillospiraceae bacterium]
MASKIYPDELTARNEIIEVGRRLYMRGFVCANDGNLSARLSENIILATPSGVSKGFMNNDMLIKLDFDGNIIEGQQNPSSEIKMHLAIYKHAPDITAVCHAHPPISTTFAAAGVPLDKAILQETAVSLGVIPIAKYAMPGSDELAAAAAKYCTQYHGVLLEHHGPVTWGGSVMQALFRMESIEYTATVTMYSKIMGFNRTMTKEQVTQLMTLRPGLGITADLGEFKLSDD